MKNVADSITEEFKLRMFDESFARIRKCLSLVSDEDLWISPNDKITSIGSSVQHVIGNSIQWIVSTIGGEADGRIRSAEFKASSKSKEQLLDDLQRAEVKIKSAISRLSNDQLDERFVVQNFEVTGLSIIVHVIEHTSYHTGQISLLAKLFTEKDLGYYDGFQLE
jgi:uncharacterized damage-inducible protein DinB